MALRTSTEHLSTEPLLDTDPTVILDVSLGKHLKNGQVIQVDYPALRQTMEAVNAPEDNSGLSIVLQSPESMPKNTSGRYRNRNLEVSYSKPRTMQETLQHEATHYADKDDRPMTKRERRNHRLGQLGIKTVFTSTPVALLTQVTEVVAARCHVPFISDMMAQEATREYAMAAVAAPLMSSLGGAALAGMFYLANRQERAARKAEKLPLPPVFVTKDHE